MATTKKAESNLNESINFEQSLKDLEDIVRKMEQGELSLEHSLEAFEEGVKLTRNCQTALQKAEQKVAILVKNSDGKLTTTDFNTSQPS